MVDTNLMAESVNHRGVSRLISITAFYTAFTDN